MWCLLLTLVCVCRRPTSSSAWLWKGKSECWGDDNDVLRANRKDLVYSGNGSLYATDQRIIFRALKATPQLTSVFVPLYFCRKISLVQPLLFGANYITCDVVPVRVVWAVWVG